MSAAEVEGLYLFTSGIPNQPQDVISAFLQECCSGRSLQLHVVLFNVDDYDANGAMPSRYANITQTAECLRALAHCSGGRFHWFRETGQASLSYSSSICSIYVDNSFRAWCTHIGTLRRCVLVLLVYFTRDFCVDVSPGIIESDDISAVALEIEKALNFSNKAAMLVESVKKKYGMVRHHTRIHDRLQCVRRSRC